MRALDDAEAAAAGGQTQLEEARDSLSASQSRHGDGEVGVVVFVVAAAEGGGWWVAVGAFWGVLFLWWKRSLDTSVMWSRAMAMRERAFGDVFLFRGRS